MKKVPGKALSMSTTNETSKNAQASMSPDKPICDSSQVNVYLIQYLPLVIIVVLVY